jgi:hypothetical protein
MKTIILRCTVALAWLLFLAQLWFVQHVRHELARERSQAKHSIESVTEEMRAQGFSNVCFIVVAETRGIPMAGAINSNGVDMHVGFSIGPTFNFATNLVAHDRRRL